MATVLQKREMVYNGLEKRGKGMATVLQKREMV